MNVLVSYRAEVKDGVLDQLAAQLPVIVAQVMEVPGGNVARLKPEQISLLFSEANSRDTGADLRIMAFAKSNYARKTTEHDRAKEILDKVRALIASSGEEYSVHVRLYLTEIGTAEGNTDK